MKTLILCDIDGCLNAGKLQRLDLDTLGRIRERTRDLRESGTGFTLCTGRPQPYAEAIGTLLDIDLPMICENGSMLFFPATDRVKPLVGSAATGNMQEARVRIADMAWLDAGMFIEMGKEFSFSLTGPAIAERSEGELDDLSDRILTGLSGLGLDATHSRSAIDITLKGINKGSALPHLLSELEVTGHTPTTLVGIGDSAGDMSFLTRMDRVLCPANAAESVRRIAERVSAASFADGTLELLDFIA